MAVADTGVAFTEFGGKGAYSVKKKAKTVKKNLPFLH